MSRLSALGFTILLAAAGLHLVAVLQRPSADWRAWRVGAWAPLEEFGPKGRYCAVGARALTGVGLLLYVIGMHWSSGRP
jgi:hypothetical protein